VFESFTHQCRQHPRPSFGNETGIERCARTAQQTLGMPALAKDLHDLRAPQQAG
jgi:hypothetical protein